MTSPIADGVLAATHRLVQQAMSGQWADVPRTIEERRALLDRLTATATANDQQWLGALRQAMAESDAAVARMQAADPIASIARAAPSPAPTDPATSEAAVDSLMDMIVKGR
jgi:hypothetical protein